MSKHSFLLILSLTLIAACGGEKQVNPFPKSRVFEVKNDNSTPTERTADDFREELQGLSYQFFSDNPSETCATGYKKFKTEHELCMNLLDEKFNNGCAGRTRLDAFSAFCIPKAYLPNDGLQCRYGILKEDAKPSIESADANLCYDQYKKADFEFPLREVCVGRNAGLKDSDAYIHNNLLFDYNSELNARVSSVYIKPEKITTEEFTRFSVELKTAIEKYEITYQNGMTSTTGCVSTSLQSKTRAYRLYFACKRVIGCR